MLVVCFANLPLPCVVISRNCQWLLIVNKYTIIGLDLRVVCEALGVGEKLIDLR
jgi:hypothetical protein